MGEFSMIVNDVINANPEENYIRDHLMAHLQKDLGPESFWENQKQWRDTEFDGKHSKL
jgi:hypothetical protein